MKKWLNDKLILIDELIFKTKVFEFLNTDVDDNTATDFVDTLKEEKENVKLMLKQFESEAV